MKKSGSKLELHGSSPLTMMSLMYGEQTDPTLANMLLCPTARERNLVGYSSAVYVHNNWNAAVMATLPVWENVTTAQCVSVQSASLMSVLTSLHRESMMTVHSDKPLNENLSVNRSLFLEV